MELHCKIWQQQFFKQLRFAASELGVRVHSGRESSVDVPRYFCLTSYVPIYEYRCTKCGHEFEIIQKVSAPPRKKCEKCKARAERLVSSPAIQFKGSGWYITDYARKGQPEASDESKKKASSEKSEGSSKSESKGSPKKDSSAKKSDSKKAGSAKSA